MIQIDESQFRRVQDILQHLPNKIPQAVSSAINRASESARTEAVRKAREDYVIQASGVRETIDIRKASANNLFASMLSRGRPRPLSMFKIRPGRRGSAQLIAQVKRGGGGTIRGAFVARMREVGFGRGRRLAEPGQGHEAVFRRLGKQRNPIEESYGPSVPQMLQSPTINKFIQDKAVETLNKSLEHEINRILMR